MFTNHTAPLREQMSLGAYLLYVLNKARHVVLDDFELFSLGSRRLGGVWRYGTTISMPLERHGDHLCLPPCSCSHDEWMHSAL